MIYEPCEHAKHCRSVYPTSNKRSSVPFHLALSDVWGPAPTVLLFGFRYFVTFVNDYSRATWVYLLKAKNDVFSTVKSYIRMVSTQFDTKVCIFHSNMEGSIYLGEYLHFLMNVAFFTRLLVQVPQNKMFTMNVPKTFWSKVVQTAHFLMYRLLACVLNFCTALDLLSSITHLFPLPPKTFKCIFLGYVVT